VEGVLPEKGEGSAGICPVVVLVKVFSGWRSEANPVTRNVGGRKVKSTSGVDVKGAL